MYAYTKYSTPRQLRAGVRAEKVSFTPCNPYGEDAPKRGRIWVQPQYPGNERWKARCEVENGKITRVVRVVRNQEWLMSKYL